MFRFVSILAAVAMFLASATVQSGEKVVRIGIIGCDTSHVVAFTNSFNVNAKKVPELMGFKVVAAYPGGSQDIPDSKNRLEMFTNTLRDKYGVEIVNSIDELLTKVDVVLLESVDGRPHLKQAIPVFKSGKLVFIDKPVAGSLADLLMLQEYSKKYKTPFFSSSSLRYYPGVQGAKNDPKIGDVIGCVAYYVCTLEPHHPDFFWYGIHGMEMLYAIMGQGCQTVSRTHTPDADVATGVWKDGRIGTFRGVRKNPSGNAALVFGSKGVQTTDMKGGGYDVLLVEVAKFFKTGRPPIALEETIELFAFMEAADESKRQGGAPVAIETVLRKAREVNAGRKVE